MTLKALWKTSRLMGVPRSYTHSITKPEVTWSVQGEKGKDNKIPKKSNECTALCYQVRQWKQNPFSWLQAFRRSQLRSSVQLQPKGRRKKLVLAEFSNDFQFSRPNRSKNTICWLTGYSESILSPKKIWIVFNDHAKNIERFVFLVEFYGEVQVRSKE